MKRVFLLFCTGILLLCFVSGCAQPPGGSTSKPDKSQNSVSSPAASPEPSTPELSGLAALREEINQNRNIGAAFIGYVHSQSTEEELFRYLSESETGRNAETAPSNGIRRIPPSRDSAPAQVSEAPPHDGKSREEWKSSSLARQFCPGNSTKKDDRPEELDQFPDAQSSSH